jgi:hypothetical protein
MYAVNCPCGKGLVVTLLNKCGFLGMLAILALGNIHAVFGIRTVLAFGNVHAFGDVHAISSILTVPDLGVFVLFIVTWCNMVVVASHKRQHKNLIVAWELYLSFPCIHCFIVVAPCNASIKNNCGVVDVVVMALRSILLLALHTFAIIDVVDPH